MIDDELLEQKLERWAQRELARTPDTELPDLSSDVRRRPVRFMAIVAAAAVVLAVAVGVALLFGRGKDSPGPVLTAPRPVSASELVVRNSDTVTGQGVVLALPGRAVRFCAPAGVILQSVDRGNRFDYCRLGLTVTGVDLNQLADRATRRDGAIYGLARLVELTVAGRSP